MHGISNDLKDFFSLARFRFEKITVKRLCLMAMLIAITTVLSIYGTFRIGDIIKIPTKFVSVFIGGAMFGPWIGGLIGAMGDLLNVWFMPSGPWLPLLTLGEFISGFIFGLFFYRLKYKSLSYYIRTAMCVIFLFLLDMFYSTWVLCTAGYFPSFDVAFISRIFAGIIKLILNAVYIIIAPAILTICDKVTK